MPEEFPNVAKANGAIASQTSGRIGVVAAWSRYITATYCRSLPIFRDAGEPSRQT